MFVYRPVNVYEFYICATKDSCGIGGAKLCIRRLVRVTCGGARFLRLLCSLVCEAKNCVRCIAFVRPLECRVAQRVGPSCAVVELFCL